MPTRSPGRTPPAMRAWATPFEASSSSAYVSNRPRQRTASRSAAAFAASLSRSCRRKVTAPPPPLQPQAVSDDPSLDLGRPGVDRAADGVPQATLDLGLRHVPIPTEDLHRVELGPDRRLADIRLRYSG